MTQSVTEVPGYVYATLITLGILTMMLCGVLIYGVGR